MLLLNYQIFRFANLHKRVDQKMLKNLVSIMNSAKDIIKQVPYIGKLATKVAAFVRSQRSSWSRRYWEKRYASGGNSGSGSYNRLAEFKAEVLNSFIERNTVHSVIEFGCGDGNQLSLARYPKYIGIDISPTVIERCKEKFSSDRTKEFLTYQPKVLESNLTKFQSELSLSIDVIFHLVEDGTFEEYMTSLFKYAQSFVIIYSSNSNSVQKYHVKHRRFTDWVVQNQPSWRLIEKIDNKFKFDPKDPDSTSFCDFYIYERVAQ